ncbi:hypothetical protein SRB5_56430 [Streptomyces sp. RB5]|uniref:Uncharacterized protein n=1 Tax=Streptomyces smaragdinus TaxID=2585196 RepID=A0A7K0CPY0_9ACTN|nr:hypothetical protein [Streptomyces smaragdinus]MQY15461.1 hypothetical protein [Streptomyces smaragdinus]
MSDADLEDEFAAGIRQAADITTPPSSTVLVARGLKRGKQLRRRRNAGIAVVAALAVGGVGFTAQLLTGGSDDGTVSSPASGGTSVTTKKDGKPGTEQQNGTISGEKVAALVKAELLRIEGLGADTKVTVPYSRGTKVDDSSPGNPFAMLVYDDGGGKASMTVDFTRQSPGELAEGGTFTCPDKSLVKFDSCTVEHLPGGARAMLYQGYEYGDSRPGPRRWEVTYSKADGTTVHVSSLNSVEEKGSVTRPGPPLDLKQLKALALSKAWAPVLAELNAPAADPGSSERAPEYSPNDITRTLASLLPKSLEIVRRSDGGVAVDDGRGVAILDATVSPPGELFGEKDDASRYTDTLPDGTKMVVYQGPGEKGGKGVNRWFVDVVRPNGRRVAIQLHNSSAQWKPATRPDMPLTIDQLKDMTLSPKWQSLKLS